MVELNSVFASPHPIHRCINPLHAGIAHLIFSANKNWEMFTNRFDMSICIFLLCDVFRYYPSYAGISHPCCTFSKISGKRLIERNKSFALKTFWNQYEWCNATMRTICPISKCKLMGGKKVMKNKWNSNQ